MEKQLIRHFFFFRKSSTLDKQINCVWIIDTIINYVLYQFLKFMLFDALVWPFFYFTVPSQLFVQGMNLTIDGNNSSRPKTTTATMNQFCSLDWSDEIRIEGYPTATKVSGMPPSLDKVHRIGILINETFWKSSSSKDLRINYLLLRDLRPWVVNNYRG